VSLGLRDGTVPGQCVGVGVGEELTAGVSVSDGRLLWAARVQVPYYFPLVSEGRIPVVSLGDRFCVIDERTGKLLVDRMQHTGMFHQKTGSMWGGDIVAFPAESGHIAVFRVSTGELLALEQTDRPLWSSVVVDGRLVVASSTGEVLAYSLEDAPAAVQ